MTFQCDLHQLVQLVRRNSFVRLFEKHLSVVQKCFYILAGLAGNESDRAVCHGRKRLVHVANPAFGRHLAGEQVPFVHDEDTRLVLVSDVMSKLLVNLAHLLFRVEEHQDDVGSANAALGSVHSVPIDIGFNAFVSAQAWRIHGHELMTVQVKHDVYAIAGGSRHLANDHSLGFNERVHECALSDIAFSDNRKLHHWRFDFGRHGIQLRDALHDQVKQFVFVSILMNANPDQPSSTELMKLVRIGVKRWTIGLVGHQQYRFVDLAKPIRNFLVQRQHTRPGIDDEQKNVRVIDSDFDLRFNIGRQIVNVDNSHSARIDQLKMVSAMFDQRCQTIPSYSSSILNDCKSTTGNPIEKRAFADIGSTYNGYARNWHRKSRNRETVEI